MQKEAVKDNILSPRQWLRILLMVGFVLLSWLLRFVQVAVAFIQALFALITGRTNTNLRKAGAVLSLYQAHIWLFLSYCTERRPYPFTDLPQSLDDLGGDMNLAEDPAEQKTDAATSAAVMEPAVDDEASADPGADVAETDPAPPPSAGQWSDSAQGTSSMSDHPKEGDGDADTGDRGRSL